MRKLLIIVLILILSALAFVIAVKGVKIGNFKIDSIKQIQASSINLDKNLKQANELTNKTYKESLSNLDELIQAFTNTKSQYDSKVKYNDNEVQVGTVQLQTYEIEFLWTIVGNYATKEGVTLTLDIKDGKTKGNYNLSFTLTGSYVGITDFIYDLENDEKLNFKIENLNMGIVVINATPTTTTATTTNNVVNNTTNTTTNTTVNTTVNNTTNTTANNTTNKNIKTALQAKFDVNDISINLD